MSSKLKRTQNKILSQRINTVVQVLAIMQAEADRMNWFQRLRISWSFLWKKNIDVFFEEAKNGKEEIQDSGKE